MADLIPLTVLFGNPERVSPGYPPTAPSWPGLPPTGACSMSG